MTAAPRGIALSLHPLRPASDSAADAAARHDGLRYRWFLDPLYGRGYPADTLAAIGAAAPVVAAGDMEAIAVATDFLGVNYYFPETVADAPGHGPLDAQVLPAGAVETTDLGWGGGAAGDDAAAGAHRARLPSGADVRHRERLVL